MGNYGPPGPLRVCSVSEKSLLPDCAHIIQNLSLIEVRPLVLRESRSFPQGSVQVPFLGGCPPMLSFLSS
jgi:hypothetical protein